MRSRESVLDAKRNGRSIGIVSNDAVQIRCLEIAGLLPKLVIGPTLKFV